jgi:hypothetical protein
MESALLELQSRYANFVQIVSPPANQGAGQTLVIPSQTGCTGACLGRNDQSLPSHKGREWGRAYPLPAVPAVSSRRLCTLLGCSLSLQDIAVGRVAQTLLWDNYFSCHQHILQGSPMLPWTTKCLQSTCGDCLTINLTCNLNKVP